MMNEQKLFGGSVEKLAQSTVRPQPRSVEVVYLPVTISTLTGFLATSLTRVIEQLATKSIDLSAEQVLRAFEYLVLMRVAYCAGLKSHTHPKDVEYPAFMFPVLQAIGKYINASKGYEIIPVPADEQYVEKDSEGNITGIAHEAVKGGKKPKTIPEMTEEYKDVMRVLRSMGVAMSYGIPMDRYAQNDDLYRMEVADQILYGPEAVPAPTVIVARVLLRLNYLCNLFGRADQAYNVETAFRGVIEEIVFAHVRGPRTHSVA